jgi:hypothetical protein
MTQKLGNQIFPENEKIYFKIAQSYFSNNPEYNLIYSQKLTFKIIISNPTFLVLYVFRLIIINNRVYLQINSRPLMEISILIS